VKGEKDNLEKERKGSTRRFCERKTLKDCVSYERIRVLRPSGAGISNREDGRRDK